MLRAPQLPRPALFLSLRFILGSLAWSACGNSNKSSSNAPGISSVGTTGVTGGSGSGTGGSGGGSGSGSEGSGSGRGTGSGSGGGTGSGGTGSGSVAVNTEVVASGLTVPWSLQFAPDGRLFLTEQSGRLRVIANGKLQAQPVFEVTSGQDRSRATTMKVRAERALCPYSLGRNRGPA